MSEARDTDSEGGVPGGGSAAAQLRWSGPDGAARLLDLDGAAPVTIGRGAGNTIVLRGQGVSRRHASLTAIVGGTAFTLTDLGSSNGTDLNDRPLTAPAELRPGDRFTIGPTVFTFTADPAQPPAVGTVATPTGTLPRVIAAGLTADGRSVIDLRFAVAGWLELPNGERRILGGETRIGRSARNDIAIEDGRVSRSHAHIRRIDGRFVLSDLGSVNGVRVNGEPVLTPRELADGDRIALGGAVLRFSLAPFGGGTPGTTTLAALAGGAAPSSSRLLGLVADGAPAALRGDLREVTVLFADLHGFTALSERLNDPELTTGIINQVFDLLTAAVVRYDGAIDKYSGDNIMALFGAPRAHEDDPERAVRAALAMQGALAGFNQRLRRELGLGLRIRVGINTGEVLFGQVGGGAFRSYTVMGDTVNLAARLEQAARPGSILIGEATHALTRQAFEITALPPLEIRGKREPVRAYEVARAREGRAAEAPHGPAEGDYLIGRAGEVGRLRAALEDARGGRGRLLAIVGDAGIGKSRLLAGFRRSDAGAGADWIVARCPSYEATAPGALLAGLLRALLGLDCEEALDRPKLRAALGAVLPDAGEEAHAACLALLGRAVGGAAADAPPGGQVTAVLRDLVAARVRAGGGAGPLVLALEELQWADGPGVEALDGLVDALPGLPVLLLLTYRPEWRHGWGGRPFYREIVLHELPPEQSRRFLRRALGPPPLPDEVADAIFDRCGGNPLLLEETVRWLRERGALVDAGGRWALAGDVARLGSPSTLRGLVMARLDRLAERDRAVLQRAAVIGRSFTFRLLALMTEPCDALDDSLAALQDRELIVEDALAAEPAYRFKQAMVQEIVYGSVLAAERRALHGRIGAAIERTLTGAEGDGDQVDVLAHHYGRGGSRRKAAEYLLRSGERARALGANATAIARFEAALEQLGRLPPAEQAREPQTGLLLCLREALGDVALVIADFRRAQESYEAALLVGEVPRLDQARLWRKLGTVWERRGDHRKALGSFERGLALRDPADGPVEPAGLRAAAARPHRPRRLRAGDRAGERGIGGGRGTARPGGRAGARRRAARPRPGGLRGGRTGRGIRSSRPESRDPPRAR